jgi:hypothetical protein
MEEIIAGEASSATVWRSNNKNGDRILLKLYVAVPLMPEQRRFLLTPKQAEVLIKQLERAVYLARAKW